MRKLVWFATILLAIGQAKAQKPSARQQDLVQLAQWRFQAFFDGDRVAYERLVARDVIFAYSNGRTLDYAQAMQELKPLAKPGSFSFHYEDVQFRDFGNSALLVYRLVFHGPDGDYQGIESDAFAWRDSAWQLVEVHGTTTPYPNRPHTVVDSRLLDEYVGRYEKAPGVYYDVSRDGNQLIGQRTGLDRVPWMAESNDVFYVPSDPTASRLFLRDSSGRVSKLVRVDIQGNTVWRRQSALPGSQ